MNLYYDTYKKDYSTALVQGIAAIGSSWRYGLIVVEKVVNIPYPGTCFEWGVIPYPCIQYLPVPMYSYEINTPFDLTGVPLGWHPFSLPELNIDVSNEMLSKYGMDYGQQIFSLLHEYLYAAPSAIPNEIYIGMIQSAPCEGPRHMPYNDPNELGVDGWRATNRFNRPLNADGWIDHDNDFSAGEFNGMDYMLLHNLYTLARGGITTPFKNRLNQVSSETLTNSGNHWSYETLEFNGTIQANAATASAPVELSSGKSIKFTPGFHTQPGATMKAYTANYTACNTSMQQSAALRRDESKPAHHTALDTLAIKNAINKSLQAKIGDATTSAIAQLQSKSGYTPLSEYLENRAKEVLAEDENGSSLILYPNPTSGSLRIGVTLKEGQFTTVRLRDINGKELAEVFGGFMNKGSNEGTINVEHLQAGTYLIDLQGNSFSDYQRFVKTKN